MLTDLIARHSIESDMASQTPHQHEVDHYNPDDANSADQAMPTSLLD